MRVHESRSPTAGNEHEISPGWGTDQRRSQFVEKGCECEWSRAGSQPAMHPGEISEQAGTPGPGWLADKAPTPDSVLRRAHRAGSGTPVRPIPTLRPRHPPPPRSLSGFFQQRRAGDCRSQRREQSGVRRRCTVNHEAQVDALGTRGGLEAACEDLLAHSFKKIHPWVHSGPQPSGYLSSRGAHWVTPRQAASPCPSPRKVLAPCRQVPLRTAPLAVPAGKNGSFGWEREEHPEHPFR